MGGDPKESWEDYVEKMPEEGMGTVQATGTVTPVDPITVPANPEAVVTEIIN